MPITLPDLHGRSDLLRATLAHYGGGAAFVFLGDAIDRGPDSLGVVRELLALSDADRVELVLGNHEAMLAEAAELDRLGREEGDGRLLRQARLVFNNWTRNGGESVLRECGGFGPDSVPGVLLEYISRTRLAVGVGGRLCSHAAPPRENARRLGPEPALWARPDEGPFPLPPGVKESLHGHTPLVGPTWVGRHLYTDLGAVHTGALCTVDLESLEAVVFQGKGEKPREAMARLGSSRDGFVRPHPYRVVEV